MYIVGYTVGKHVKVQPYIRPRQMWIQLSLIFNVTAEILLFWKTNLHVCVINSSKLYKLTFLRLEDLFIFCFSSFLSSALSPWYSSKPDWDFLHQPVGKLKKQTAARLLHACRTSIRYVIVMLKWHHHIAFQRIQNVLEAFFHFFFQYEMQYLVVSRKKNPLFVWGWEKICP